MAGSGDSALTESQQSVPIGERFSALPIPEPHGELLSFSSTLMGAGPHRLGKDPQGAAALLIAASGGRSRVPHIELEHIVVLHDVRCVLWHSDASREEATFTLVRCKTTDRVLRDYFLGLTETVLVNLGSAPSESRVQAVIGSLVELFRSLMKPGKKTVQGLWAELFLIAEAGDAQALVEAWHTKPEEAYDFSASDDRLEVKSSSGSERCHHFRLEQVRPRPGLRVLIASLFVEPVGLGVSLGDLLGSIRDHISATPELLLRMERIVAESLGDNWRRALEDSFDIQRARTSLRFFDAPSLPAVDPNLPAGVTEVRFRADLSLASPVLVQAQGEAGGLFAAALPARAGRGVR